MNTKLKEITILLLLIILIISPIIKVSASAPVTEQQAIDSFSKMRYQNVTTVTLFWGNGCPHCADEIKALYQLRKELRFNVNAYEVYQHQKNNTLFKQYCARFNQKPEGVPTLFIGNYEPIIGFIDTPEFIDRIKNQITKSNNNLNKNKTTKKENTNLTIFGSNVSELSMPLFTIVIAGLDSFNPCAFFVLSFLLSLLIYTKSRKRVIIIGSIYSFFAALIYLTIMAGWLNVFLLLNQVKIILILAGLFTLMISVVNIKDYFFFKKGISFTISDKNKPKLFDRMRKLLNAKSFTTLIIATIILSVSGNLYAGLCSAGFPIIYTSKLASLNISTLMRYIYLLSYILIYIIPYLIITFFVAITFKSKKLSKDLGEFLKLLSGLMLGGLSLSLIFNPTYLNNPIFSIGLLLSSLFISLLIDEIKKIIKTKESDNREIKKKILILNLYYLLSVLSIPLSLNTVMKHNYFIDILYYLSIIIISIILNAIVKYIRQDIKKR
ncbi:MAG: hypothetical protein GWP09_01410 [Nitrospiraceae bacterium]|nr:hypothetical protein [Nitrospiraceae bacterium]